MPVDFADEVGDYDYYDSSGDIWLDSLEGVELDDVPVMQYEHLRGVGIQEELGNMCDNFKVYHLQKRHEVENYHKSLDVR